MKEVIILAVIFIGGFITVSCGKSTDDTIYKQGKQYYEHFCSSCHRDNGKGLGALYPTLAGSDYLAANQQILPCIIKHGLNEPIVVNGKEFHQEMPANKKLSAIDVTNIINYINTSWGNNLPPTTVEVTTQALENCLPK